MQDADLLDRALVAARARATRDEARAKARAACRELGIGQSFVVPISADHPARRDVVTAVNGAAYGILGPGRFKLVRAPRYVAITRIEREGLDA